MFKQTKINQCYKNSFVNFPKEMYNNIKFKYVNDNYSLITFDGSLHHIRLIVLLLNNYFNENFKNRIDKYFILDVILSIEEILANVFEHSYSKHSGKAEIHLIIDEDHLKVEIIDYGENGHKFNLEDTNNIIEDKFSYSGRGILIVRKATDSLNYSSENGINHFEFTKKLNSDS